MEGATGRHHRDLSRSLGRARDRGWTDIVMGRRPRAELGTWGACLLAACAPRPGGGAAPASPPATAAAASAASPSPAAPAAASAAVTSASAPVPSSHWESPADGAPRIGSVKHSTFVWAEPLRARDRLAIGRLRLGTTVRLKTGRPVPGSGCHGDWFEIEPFGFVCADDTTTRDFSTPYWQALADVAPADGPFPYRYAFSTGAPMYHRVPTEREQHLNEHWSYGPVRTFRPLGRWSEGHEALVIKDPAQPIEPTDPLPAYLADHATIPGSPYRSRAPKAQELPAGSGVAYARAFAAAGRTWLLTPELLLVPADRVFPYARSSFHGVELDGEVRLPLAWVRSAGEPRLARGADGTFAPAGPPFGERTPVPLTGQRARQGKHDFWETREPGVWLEERDGAVVVEAVTRLPGNLDPDERWLDARILTGYAVAYVGLEPKWTTLWSPGKGGVPVAGNDPIKFATTSVGIFTFQWKEKVATMSPDPGTPTVFWFADVPHIQYVQGPLALHVTYWHERFGWPMSAECMNFSPLDGEWLHRFTEPPLPPGWNAVRGSALTGRASRVVIRPR